MVGEPSGWMDVLPAQKREVTPALTGGALRLFLHNTCKGQFSVFQADPPVVGQLEDGLQVRTDHAGVRVSERYGCQVRVVTEGAFIACDPPAVSRTAVREYGLLLHPR